MNENSNPLPPQYQTPLPAPVVPVRRRHSLTIIISLISAVLVIVIALIAFKTFAPKPTPTLTAQEAAAKLREIRQQVADEYLKQDYDKASAILEEAKKFYAKTSIGPKLGTLYASHLLYHGDPHQAVAEIETIDEDSIKDEDKADFYWRKSNCYEQIGDSEKAAHYAQLKEKYAEYGPGGFGGGFSN